MESLKSFIKKRIEIPNDQLEEILHSFEPKVIPANGFLVKKGGISNELSFIEKGTFRHFHFTSEGKEATACFLFEGNFAFEVVSFLTRVSSEEIMQAMENSKVYSIHYNSLQQLYQKYPLWERFGRILMEEQFAEFKKIVLSQIRETAEERYLQLVREQPALFQKASQKHIASFLGITNTSLSRLRKEILQKDRKLP